MASALILPILRFQCGRASPHASGPSVMILPSVGLRTSDILSFPPPLAQRAGFHVRRSALKAHHRGHSASRPLEIAARQDATPAMSSLSFLVVEVDEGAISPTTDRSNFHAKTLRSHFVPFLSRRSKIIRTRLQPKSCRSREAVDTYSTEATDHPRVRPGRPGGL